MLYAFLLIGLLPLAFLTDEESEVQDKDILPEDENNNAFLGESDNWLEEVVSDKSGKSDIAESDNDLDVLQPVVQDDVAEAAGENPDPEEVLSPIVEDDVLTVSDGEEGEILQPIIEDDVPNLIEAEFSDMAFGFAEIAEFDVENDVILISTEDEAKLSEEDILLQTSENGDDTEVYVKGELAATLKNVTNAKIANIRLTH